MIKHKFLTLFVALCATTALWASNVITYTATEKLTSSTLDVGETTFGSAITSHDFSNGIGTITCDGEVTTIGYSAFVYCSGLTSVTIGNSVTTIGEMAFADCSGLTSVTIPNSVTTIGEGAFFDCVSLQSVTLSEGLITIGEMAFSMTGLTSITIPASVTEIGIYAFYASSALTSVTFLGNACQNAIGEMAFLSVGDPNPALLTLPDNWTGTKPDEDGTWYGGKFELREDPTALPTLFGANVDANKFLYNGQVIIRQGNKTYNVVGQEL